MHYKNGREAKNGDKVICLPTYPGAVPVAGILYDATLGNDYCNGRIAITSTNDPMPNLKECLHAADVAFFFEQATPDDPMPVKPAPPPVDNADVAEGCEPFPEPKA